MPTSVLFVGGTGVISFSAVLESVRQGFEVSVLTRGQHPTARRLPEQVNRITADGRDPESIRQALAGRGFDCVINFLTYGPGDAEWAVDVFTGRTAQYIHISSASVYRKPVRKLPIVESTVRQNPFLAYAREKIAAEDVFRQAYDIRAFPVTIVRPAHTYDDGSPPLPGDWTTWARVADGGELVVPGDGTSMWTLTHAEDVATGLVGLIANPAAVGEDFHITSQEVLNWDEIYRTIAAHHGLEPRLKHLPAEFFPLAVPEWRWADLILGDLSHSASFDNSKIAHYVPGFRPTITWAQGVRRLAEWRAEHPELTAPNAQIDGFHSRLLLAHRAAAAAVSHYPKDLNS